MLLQPDQAAIAGLPLSVPPKDGGRGIGQDARGIDDGEGGIGVDGGDVTFGAGGQGVPGVSADDGIARGHIDGEVGVVAGDSVAAAADGGVDGVGSAGGRRSPGRGDGGGFGGGGIGGDQAIAGGGLNHVVDVIAVGAGVGCGQDDGVRGAALRGTPGEDFLMGSDLVAEGASGIVEVVIDLVEEGLLLLGSQVGGGGQVEEADIVEGVTAEIAELGIAAVVDGLIGHEVDARDSLDAGQGVCGDVAHGEVGLIDQEAGGGFGPVGRQAVLAAVALGSPVVDVLVGGAGHP